MCKGPRNRRGGATLRPHEHYTRREKMEQLGLTKEELEEAMQPAAERLEALIRELLESSVEWRSEEHDN